MAKLVVNRSRRKVEGFGKKRSGNKDLVKSTVQHEIDSQAPPMKRQTQPTRKPVNGFQRTRKDHATETAEDYVEAVAHLVEVGGEARVKDLAELMGVSHVTVSRIVKRLCERGLLQTEPYRPIGLTAKGRRLAASSRKRHEAVVAFLRAIGVSARQAELDAEGIEHHVSPETLRAMERVVADGSPRGRTRHRPD